MKKPLIVLCVAVAAFAYIFTSCDEKLVLSEDIKNIVPDSTLNKITDLGMPVNKGKTPPALVNYYKASPFTLKATNVPNDGYTIGRVISDYNFRFYDQDNENLSIKIDYECGGEEGTGLGGFISGDGNDFSVFIKVHSTYSGQQADFLFIFSGTMTSEGIENLHFANFMLNDYGDPGGVWMAQDCGRIFYDSDGMSPIVQSLQSKASKSVFGTCPGLTLISQ